MTFFERENLIADCLEACRTNALRTDDEHREVRERGQEAARLLGYEFPEDVMERESIYTAQSINHARLFSPISIFPQPVNELPFEGTGNPFAGSGEIPF